MTVARLAWWHWVLVGLASLCLVGYLTVCTVLFTQQRSQIYFSHAHSPVGQPETRTLSVDGTAVPHHALYLLHYRGYGGTPGQPSESALLADALALFDKAHAEHREVLLVGRSLGTGPAVRVASLRPAARMVLLTQAQ